MGHLASLVLVIKTIYQKLWEKELAWDEPVPEVIEKDRKELIARLEQLGTLTILRWINFDYAIGFTVELHVLNDASETAYGAVAYIRCIGSVGKVDTQLLCSNTRVTPLPLRPVTYGYFGRIMVSIEVVSPAILLTTTRQDSRQVLLHRLIIIALAD